MATRRSSRIKRPRASWRCSECGCEDGRQAIGPQAIHEACKAPDGPGKFVPWFPGPDLVEFVRAGNLRCLAPGCGKLYSQHPHAHGPGAEGCDGPFLRVICGSRGSIFDKDARVVKL